MFIANMLTYAGRHVTQSHAKVYNRPVSGCKYYVFSSHMFGVEETVAPLDIHTLNDYLK